MGHYLSRGGSHTTSIKNDGTLWAWGYNYYGQLGDGTTDSKNIPTQEATASITWFSVSAGVRHTVAIKSDGTLWSWGQNYYGQLGDGTTTDKNIPIQEATASNTWSHVSVGSPHTVAIKNDGTLWVWGERDDLGYFY